MTISHFSIWEKGLSMFWMAIRIFNQNDSAVLVNFFVHLDTQNSSHFSGLLYKCLKNLNCPLHYTFDLLNPYLSVWTSWPAGIFIIYWLLAVSCLIFVFFFPFMEYKEIWINEAFFSYLYWRLYIIAEGMER